MAMGSTERLLAHSKMLGFADVVFTEIYLRSSGSTPMFSNCSPERFETALSECGKLCAAIGVEDQEVSEVFTVHILSEMGNAFKIPRYFNLVLA
jgi:hypothetical protein